MPRILPAIAVTSLLAAGAAGLLQSCASSGGEPSAAAHPAPAKVDPPTLTDEKPRDYPGVHNVVAYHDGFYSGSVPEGDAGFDTLERMGIKTIISVDGAVPEVEEARARGIRYVHLPIGYNGFDEERKLELVRAVHDLPGPVYIHCHHGKHRSAGAAGAIAVSLGWMTPEAAVGRMKVSGTAPNYKGLYRCAEESISLTVVEIDAAPADFPEVAPPAGLVKSMVAIDEATEHLKAIEKAGWTVPKEHPDLVPVAEAARLADLLRLLQDNARVKAKPAEFGQMLTESAAAAQSLEDALASAAPDPATLSAAFKVVTKSCTDCHAKYRD